MSEELKFQNKTIVYIYIEQNRTENFKLFWKTMIAKASCVINQLACKFEYVGYAKNFNF